jgi:hypothetical protein
MQNIKKIWKNYEIFLINFNKALTVLEISKDSNVKGNHMNFLVTSVPDKIYFESKIIKPLRVNLKG